ncbi:NeuD/PglB/VioB family sugar acetyltransferase [Thalassobius sp. I31.1]|uniref:NeuD/PglB/VioB family sugar acetyltransferase n=1 Tax=Thalassobius sp. I31.1 TaxID=2109912 RepID=UPI0013004F96|nr:NeuD/PglB/VioB family sugar acetyltransferase [Thalassobius sp. I31.1]
MPDTPLILIGAGGHACVVAEAAHLAGWQIAGHVAPQAGGDALLGEWLGDDSALGKYLAGGAMCAIGLGFVDAASAQRRAAILAGLDTDTLATIIHPDASVSPNAQLGSGCFIAAQSVIATGAIIGCGAIVNTGAIVEHHNTIGQNAHIATGARLTGNVHVGDNVLVGAACVVRQGVCIGDGAVVGAGCVVLSDVAPNTVFIGRRGQAS